MNKCHVFTRYAPLFVLLLRQDTIQVAKHSASSKNYLSPGILYEDLLLNRGARFRHVERFVLNSQSRYVTIVDSEGFFKVERTHQSDYGLLNTIM